MQWKQKLAVIGLFFLFVPVACAPAASSTVVPTEGQVATSPVKIVVTLPPSKVLTALTCPAKDLQYLVGQSRTVLHTMRFGSETRIEEPGMAYTEEFSPTRTRIVIGASGKIEQVLCG